VKKRIPTTALHCEIDQLEDWIVGIGRPDPEGIIEFWQVCGLSLRAAEKIVDTRHTSVVVNHELVGHKAVEIGVNCDGRRQSCLEESSTITKRVDVQNRPSKSTPNNK
jgi:hypothetical protein